MGGGEVSRFNLLHLSGALSRRWPDFTILHLIAVFSGPFTTSQEANCNIFERGGRGGGAVAVAASASQDSGGRQRRRPDSLSSPSLFHISLFAVGSQSTQFRSPSPPFFTQGTWNK